MVMPRRSKGGKRRLVRVVFAMGGVVKGNAVAAIAGIPRSSSVSCEGVVVSVIREATAGVCGMVSVGADAAKAVGYDREEATSGLNREWADKASEAGKGKPDSAVEEG